MSNRKEFYSNPPSRFARYLKACTIYNHDTLWSVPWIVFELYL